jgi:DNA repair protein RadA/Sms
VKTKPVHRCTECGAEAPRWLGRCPDCGAWGSMVPAVVGSVRVGGSSLAPADPPVPITGVAATAAARRATGVPELDRVLGGGLVPGSVTLLGGEPGIGKSTLLLQALGAMSHAGARVLLVGAEESPEQVRLRAERLGVLDDRLLLAADTSLPQVVAHADALGPDVLAVDSIQAVADPDLPGAPGTVSQVREGAYRLTRLAKERAIATVLVGHVTKDGSLAGPRALEHVVDTVLSFDGDRHHTLRFLRALKHRFGSTEELGLLEMRASGLASVPDASALFLADRRAGAPGSVDTAVIEGGRPLLVEVQALVAPTAGVAPRRSAAGLDPGRVALVLAVLEQCAGVPVAGADVYANVAGGVRVTEPGVDLALALAVAGARREVGLPSGTVVLGEVGLGGELRQVPDAPRRLAEAARLGFTHALGPPSLPAVPGLATTPVDTLTAAIATAWPDQGSGGRPVRAA